MMDTKPRFILLVISFLCAVSFGWMAWLVQGEKIGRFDLKVIDMVQGLEGSALTAVMKAFTFLGDRYTVIVLSVFVFAFLLFVMRMRRELILYVWASLGSVTLNETMKVIFARERPTIHRIIEHSGFSFPSGHAMASLTLYGVLIFLLYRKIPSATGRRIFVSASVALILIIGLSRIYLGVHYPSDVIAGFLASGCWLMLSIWLYQKFVAQKKGA